MEGLETRNLLTAVPGADYVLSGFQWADPSHITYSIAPDGVQWDHGINNLEAAFDAKLGRGTWERALAKALASWEAVSNINIAQVSDSFEGFDIAGQAQGDPRFGDIRFGGYTFAGDTTTLARTYFPPPNGTTAAGDVEINVGLNFNLGADYDLYSVMLHETGHALGLDHATNPAEVMSATYGGVIAGPAPGDIAGIQAMYGARTADAFQRQGRATDVTTAVDLTGSLDAAHQVTLDATSLATIGDTEYFSVVAPTFPGAALQVTASAGNLSLLSPKVSILDDQGQMLDVEGKPDAWGNNVTAQLGQVGVGRRYTIAVSGATSDVFAVGAYHLQVAFTGDPFAAVTSPATPTPTPTNTHTTTVTPTPIPSPTPTTTTPNPTRTSATSPSPSSSPSPTTTVDPSTGGTLVSATAIPIAADAFEPNDTPATATPLGTIAATTVAGLSLNTANDVDNFSFTAARAGVYQISAPGTSVTVLSRSGTILATGYGQVVVRSSRAKATFYVEIGTSNGVAVETYSLAIGPRSASHGPTLAGIGPVVKSRGQVHRQGMLRNRVHALLHA